AAPDALRHTQASPHHRIWRVQHDRLPRNSRRTLRLELPMGARHSGDCGSLCQLGRMASVLVPLREPRLRDVAIDAFGALLAQTLVWFYANWNGFSSRRQ